MADECEGIHSETGDVTPIEAAVRQREDHEGRHKRGPDRGTATGSRPKGQAGR